MMDSEEMPEDLVKLIGGARPVFVAQVSKVNDHYDWQNRFIVVTFTRFYNVKKGKLFGKWSIRRDFEIDHIQGIVLRPCVGEFLLKINAQVSGDYRYRADCGQHLADSLVRLRGHLRVWQVTVDLDVYHRMKKHAARADIFATESSAHSTPRNRLKS